MEENTQKALDSAISQIEKDHGKGALMKLGSGSAYPDICLLYTSPSPRDRTRSRMPSSA